MYLAGERGLVHGPWFLGNLRSQKGSTFIYLFLKYWSCYGAEAGLKLEILHL